MNSQRRERNRRETTSTHLQAAQQVCTKARGVMITLEHTARYLSFESDALVVRGEHSRAAATIEYRRMIAGALEVINRSTEEYYRLMLAEDLADQPELIPGLVELS